jgi:hypothetical protein
MSSRWSEKSKTTSTPVRPHGHQRGGEPAGVHVEGDLPLKSFVGEGRPGGKFGCVKCSASSREADADKRVAAAKVGVEEAERAARLERLEPQRDLGKDDRERVEVNAVQAFPDNLALGSVDELWGDAAVSAGGAGAGKCAAEDAGGLDEECAGPHRGIAHAQRQQLASRFGGIVGGEVSDWFDDWIKCGVHEKLGDLVGRVEGAGSLSASRRGLEHEVACLEAAQHLVALDAINFEDAALVVHADE